MACIQHPFRYGTSISNDARQSSKLALSECTISHNIRRVQYIVRITDEDAHCAIHEISLFYLDDIITIISRIAKLKYRPIALKD